MKTGTACIRSRSSGEPGIRQSHDLRVHVAFPVASMPWTLNRLCEVETDCRNPQRGAARQLHLPIFERSDSHHRQCRDSLGSPARPASNPSAAKHARCFQRRRAGADCARDGRPRAKDHRCSAAQLDAALIGKASPPAATIASTIACGERSDMQRGSENPRGHLLNQSSVIHQHPPQKGGGTLMFPS